MTETCDCCAPGNAAEDVPIACTLSAEDRPARQAEWRQLLASVAERSPIDGGVRLTFPRHDGLASTVADLAEREQGCCAFFDFSLAIGRTALMLDVRAPADAAEIVTALFG